MLGCGTGSGGVSNALFMEDEQKEIMGAGLNIVAICLYLFLGH